jgi:hypothetical protein
VTAFCTAEGYDFGILKKKLQSEDVKLILMAPDVIGISLQSESNIYYVWVLLLLKGEKDNDIKFWKLCFL